MEKRDSRNKGGNTKRDDRPPRDIVEIPDLEMGKLLRKNFETFVSTEKYNKELLEEPEEEDEENKDEPKQERKPRKHDFRVYQDLSKRNGKKGAAMLHHFLT